MSYIGINNRYYLEIFDYYSIGKLPCRVFVIDNKLKNVKDFKKFLNEHNIVIQCNQFKCTFCNHEFDTKLNNQICLYCSIKHRDFCNNYDNIDYRSDIIVGKNNNTSYNCSTVIRKNNNIGNYYSATIVSNIFRFPDYILHISSNDDRCFFNDTEITGAFTE